MIDQAWKTPFWPEGVPHTIDDYNFPVFKFLDDAAKDFPDNTYTIFNGATKTYAQVKDTADRVAHFLSSIGIGKGDKVAIFLPNLPQFPEILFGILKAGAVAVNCNPAYTATELNYQLKDSQSKIVFCMDHPEFYPNTLKAIENTDVDRVILCNIKSYLPKVKGLLGGLLGKIPRADKIEPGHLRFDDVVAKSQPNPPLININPDEDTAIMLYTGGTTGRPKGAELTHTNFAYNVQAMHAWLRITQKNGGKPERLFRGDSHCFMGIMPWYHSFGITVALLLSTKLAAKLVCIPDPRAGKPPFTDVLQAIQKYRPTFMPAVPTIFVALVTHDHLDKYDLSSLMGCFSGGAPLAPEVCKQFEEKTGAIIFEGYGLTETAPVVSMNPSFKETRKVGSVGFPAPGTDVRILEPKNPEKAMPRGEDGEIAVSGPQVMKGYWNKPSANGEVFVRINGKRYFCTGDIGNIDKDGYVTLTDRKKDMILVGGFNVYPREIEDILYTHPNVELAAVVGVPDKRAGEKVKAFIKLKYGTTGTEDEFKVFCKENMAGYKRPKLIEFRDEIPVSNVGKILRRVLRDEEINA